MSKSLPKNVTQEVRTLRLVMKDGIKRKLWSSATHCARILGIPKSSLIYQLKGDGSTEAVVSSIEKIRHALDDPKDHSSGKKKTVFELFELGKSSGVWDSISSCARLIKIYRATLRRLMKSVPDSSDVRKTKFYDKVVVKMKRQLRQVPKDSASDVGSSPPKKKKSAKPTVRQDLHSASAAELLRSAIRFGLFEQEKLFRKILGEEMGSSPIDAQNAAPPDFLVASDWLTELVAGGFEIKRQSSESLRFALTSQSFTPVDNKYTERELRQTALLAQELSRRLNLVYQMKDEEVRADIARKLGPVLDELFRCKKALIICDARGAVHEIERIREFHEKIGK